MGGKASRDKGKRGELELAKALRVAGYSGSRRGQQYSGSETSADVLGLDNIHIECKRTETLSLYTAMEQAVRDSGNSGNLPTVFHRRNDKPWLVIMRMDDWLKVYKGEHI